MLVGDHANVESELGGDAGAGGCGCGNSLGNGGGGSLGIGGNVGWL